jgi:hypothetical protein
MNDQSQSTDVIIRFHAPDRLVELERAVFSLVAQNAQPVTARIVTQRFDDAAVEATRARLEPLFHAVPDARLAIHNWQEALPEDARSCLINEGVRHATGRYLSFLDYDDVLFPEAHSILKRRLQSSDATIAFASVQTMKVDVFDEFISISGRAKAPFSGSNLGDLFNENMAPIHSYLIDLERIDKKDVYFDENLTWEEDYDFLLRICAKYKSNFNEVGTFIGFYNFKTDGSNSVPTTALTVYERRKAYEAVRELISRRKREIELSPAVRATLGSLAPATGKGGAAVTIADLSCVSPYHSALGSAPAGQPQATLTRLLSSLQKHGVHATAQKITRRLRR